MKGYSEKALFTIATESKEISLSSHEDPLVPSEQPDLIIIGQKKQVELFMSYS